MNRVERASFPVTKRGEREIDRRRFLGAAACTAAVVASGKWLGRSAAAALHATASEQTPLSLATSALPEVGRATAVPLAAGGEALIVRVDAQSVVAFDRRCPHLGCPVLWSAERVRFECPCHHAAFEARTGRVLFGPPREALRAVRHSVA